MKILTSVLLSKNHGLIHGISTRTGGDPPFYNNLSKHVGDSDLSVKKNRERFFGGLRIDQSRLVYANQIHSSNVRIVKEPGLYKDTDGLITAERNLFLVVSVADCLPVMIYDRKNQVTANIHAGWRGTQKKIVCHAIDILISEFNSKPEDFCVFVGPCISLKNFEVGSDVAARFESKFVKKANNKFFVDIAGINIDSLISSGIKPTQIDSSGLCTFEEETLHSYRRDRETSGRMFAVIGMK